MFLDLIFLIVFDVFFSQLQFTECECDTGNN
jgi:hypothetical protein